MSNLKGITATIIFEASALNRDEKIGGNIPSIKKLTRFLGNEAKTFSALSKDSARNYLFESLQKLNPQRWRETSVFESGSGDNKVIQFDLKEENILKSAELDTFGYMFTIDEKNQTIQSNITRKGCVTPTKVISLEPWNGDMQFNANVGLARRCHSDPNPVNKEEHYSYFKVSFTIEVDRLGIDEWFVEKVDFSNNNLSITLGKNLISIIENVTQNAQNTQLYNYSNIGTIEYKPSDKKVIFKVSQDEKWERINDILKVIKNGLYYHSSGENYGIIPKFLIVAGLSMPVPLFHSFVELGSFEDSILDNEYILNENGNKLIYVYNPKNLVGEINCDKLYSGNQWNDFLNILKSKIENCEGTNANT